MALDLLEILGWKVLARYLIWKRVTHHLNTPVSEDLSHDSLNDELS